MNYKPIAGGTAEPRPFTGSAARDELEGFVDGLITSQLSRKPAAGAVVIVVKDGELLLAKGYGFADVERRMPVDPERTLFRPGSIGKLFTWTAVMQLVEQGKLDLDTDVNVYLRDFKIPATYPKPVTLRHLMTHTAGFEDGYAGYLIAASDEAYLPLPEFLRRHMPARVNPPAADLSNATNAAYSNWGTALAGLIVATVAGVSYDEYVERHILLPLGMTSTTFREPLPPAFAARLSVGYEFDDGLWQAHGLDRIHNFAPAGSITASGTDMAKFMLAYLQDGSVGPARILKPETLRLMLTRNMSPDPAMNGMALGFWDVRVNGRRVLWHGGDIVHFHSSLSLVPEQRLGVFVSFNTGGDAASAAREFDRDFLAHYLPGHLPEIKPPANALERNQRYAGEYRDLRRSFSRIDKVLAAGSDFQVEAMPDGTLRLFDMASNLPSRWAEIGDGVFRNIAADSVIAFKGGLGGHATRLLGPFSVFAFDRVPWYGSLLFQKWLLFLAGVLLVSMVVSAARLHRAERAAVGLLRWARPILAFAALLLLLAALGMIFLVVACSDAFDTHIPGAWYVFLTLPLLAALLVAAAMIFMFVAWRRAAWSLSARVHYTLATFGALAFLWIMNYWNVLGYRFG